MGAVFWRLCYEIMPNRASKNCETVWDTVKDYYQANAVGVQYTNFSLSTFCDPSRPRADYPSLKGKGIEIKHITAAAVEALQEHHRPANADDVKLLRVLTRLRDVQDAFDAHAQGYFLPMPTAVQILEMGDLMLVEWAELHKSLSCRLWIAGPRQASHSNGMWWLSGANYRRKYSWQCR